MKFVKSICLLMIFCILILIGCRIPSITNASKTDISSAGLPSSSITNVNSTKSSYGESVRHYTVPGESVIFFTNDGTAKAVTENGEVYLIKDPNECMTQGTSIMDIYIEQTNDEPGYVVYNQNRMSRLLLPITCDRKNAPEIVSKCYFASMLYNGEGYALSDFKINRITVKDGGNEHLIKFSINYDITPARYADRFSWYNPYSEDEYGSPKTADGLTAEVTLVGTDGMWMPISSTCPKTFDVTPSKEPISDFVALQDNRYIILETDGYTYYCDLTYKKDEDENTIYVATINSYNQKNGKIKTLLVNRDSQSFRFLDSTGDKIILTSVLAPPEGEWYDGPMYVINKNTQEVTEIDSLDTYAVTNDGIYYALKYNDQYSPVLYFYSYKTGDTTVFPNADVYYSDSLMYETQDFGFCYYDGKVLWTKGDKWYQLNQETKQVSVYVWK